MWRNRKETASSHVITKTKIDILKFFKILRDFFSIIVLHKDINVARSLILLSAIFHFSSNDTPWKKNFFYSQDILKMFFPSFSLSQPFLQKMIQVKSSNLWRHQLAKQEFKKTYCLIYREAKSSDTETWSI